MRTYSSPGPWTVDGEGHDAIVRAADKVIVAVRHRLSGKENWDNMRLIAAAPDMLAALKHAVRIYEGYGVIANPGHAPDVDPGKWVNSAREIIAKAEPRP